APCKLSYQSAWPPSTRIRPSLLSTTSTLLSGPLTSNTLSDRRCVATGSFTLAAWAITASLLLNGTALLHTGNAALATNAAYCMKFRRFIGTFAAIQAGDVMKVTGQSKLLGLVAAFSALFAAGGAMAH